MALPFIKPEFPPLLKAGRHELTVAEVRGLCVAAKRFRLSVTRREIMQNLEVVIDALGKGGIVGEIWIDGSFVTEKIDPYDVDTLLRVSSVVYDADPDKRALVDWASHEDLLETHSCDSYKWVEYAEGHPLFPISENDCAYWSGWFGTSMRGVQKGIAVVLLPATF